MWTTPYSRLAVEECDAVISPALQALIFSKLAGSLVPDSLSSYSAGLLRYTQFCNLHGIPELLCMPAPVPLLAAFIASASGTHSHACLKNWLSGLAFWHKLNLAPWYGKVDWVPLVLRTALKEGVKFKRPSRGPVTLAHLRALRKAVKLDDPEGAAIWATAMAVFWGCRRLGKVTVPSEKKIDRLRHVSRGCTMLRSQQAGRAVLVIDLPWTKLTGVNGGKCILT